MGSVLLQPVLAARDLHKAFGDRRALDGLSLEVARGELRGFVGRNGAGKTTAMRAILGLLELDSGTVTWDDRPADAAARSRFGYMPEERGLYPKMRVGEQLAWFAELHGASPADAERAARRHTERLAIDGRFDHAVEDLSLGNQQRVQLAAALVHEPDLLVLDEPFSGLDPVVVDVLATALQEEAARGVAIVFSSHQLELVERLCDAVTIVQDGRVVAAGSVDELRRSRGGDRWCVQVERPAGGVADDWIATVPGAERVDGTTDRVRIPAGTDPEALLDAARAAGAVRRFHPDEPTLAELFRDVTDATAT